jgi:hypothetical protein
MGLARVGTVRRQSGLLTHEVAGLGMARVSSLCSLGWDGNETVCLC